MTDVTPLAADHGPGTPAAEARPEPFPSRVLNTFVAPLPMFRRFGERPPWLDVFVLSIVLSLVGMVLIPQDVWVETAREAVRQNPQLAQGGAQPEQMAGMQRIFGIIAGVVMPWIMLAVMAGLATLVFSVVMGGTARFRQYVAVVAHSNLIAAVGALATLPVIMGRGSMAQITLAAVAPGLEPTSFAYYFLSMLAVFFLWQLVVIGVGAGALNRRISPATGVAVLLGLYLAISLAVAAIRA